MALFERKRRPLETDLVVVGSGAAGMVGALAARERGLDVVLLEKTARLGGTTAVSGGVVWVPNNHHMPALGIADSREEAVGYVRRLSDGRSSDALIEAFVDAAPRMAKWIEEHTPIRFTPLARYPDYHPELPGGKPGGRSLDPGLYDTQRLGEWRTRLRRSPVFGMTAMSVSEATEWGVFSNPLKLPFQLLAERYARGLVCYGGALSGGLLEALLARNVEPRLETAARELIVADGRVVGLRARHGAEQVTFEARRGVLVASGGFEWAPDLVRQFLGGPLTHPNSPPGNEGDGLRMLMAAGADLGNMSEAWWCPSLCIPGEQYDDRPLYRGDFAIRSLPHSIIVNRAGRRFVNEAMNYNDLMKAFFRFDPMRYERPNLPAWLIVDASFREKYALLTLMPGQPDPAWLKRFDSLAALAGSLGIDARALDETVKRFNGFAREGVDADFGRGSSRYDGFYADPAQRPNPNLGALEKPPFYALEVHPGAIGTKGGARTGPSGEVLHTSGLAIPGLYAAGNAMAGPTGAGYPGAGATIAAAMSFGWLAAEHAARQER